MCIVTYMNFTATDLVNGYLADDASFFLDDYYDTANEVGVARSGGKGHIAGRVAAAIDHPAAAELAARFALRA